MTRTVALPTPEQARQVRDQVIAEAQAIGKRPSVLAAARRFGLTNTTFRRHFPDIARELNEVRRTPAPDITASPDATRYIALQEQNAKLRQDKTTLTEHLELAIANIQRLTLENRGLREELESATNVTRIKTRTRTT